MADGAYDLDKHQREQEFLVEGMDDVKFEAIRLEILSNYGNAEYTCIYSVQVRGQQ